MTSERWQVLTLDFGFLLSTWWDVGRRHYKRLRALISFCVSSNIHGENGISIHSLQSFFSLKKKDDETINEETTATKNTPMQMKDQAQNRPQLK